MTDEERDNLLIRVDERVEGLHRWTVQHDDLHKDEKAARWKWIAPLYAAVIAGLSKIIFWN